MGHGELAQSQQIIGSFAHIIGKTESPANDQNDLAVAFIDLFRQFNRGDIFAPFIQYDDPAAFIFQRFQNGRDILFCPLKDGQPFSMAGMQAVAFDIGSTKAQQFGFEVVLPEGKRLTCLGDEPYNERAREYAAQADWLLCEAFCLYKDRERFKPYEKHHSTALDAGRLAAELEVVNLLLYHTEDKTLASRRHSYAEEAATYFTGSIHVPDDLEQIPL